MDAAIHYNAWDSKPRLWKSWVSLSQKNAVMSWLRLFGTTSLYPTSSLYIYKVVEHLSKMLWISSWVQPYTNTPETWGPDFGKKLDLAKWKWCRDVMVEAVDHRWLHPTFTLYIYDMFEHLQMLWISSWVQPHTNTLATGGPDFGIVGSVWVKKMPWCHGWGCWAS